MASVDGSVCVPKRYVVTILAFIGSMTLGLLQTNLSINLVEMTADKNVTVGNETHTVKAEFSWTSIEKGYILCAFSLGFMCAFVGGPVVNKFGGATSFGVSTMLSALLTVTCPAFLQAHLSVFILSRVVEGLLGGIAFVGITDTFAHWAPPAERTRLVSFYFVGFYLGAGVNYPVSGIMAYRLGWRAVFYVSGAVTFIWSVIWLIFVSNDPADDKFISAAERSYLKTKIQNMTNEKVPVPWKRILTSKPVWAFFNEYFTVYWCSSFILFCLPLYVKDVFNVNTEKVGIITGIPVLCSIIMQPIAAYIADYLRTNHLTPAKVHKIFIFWGNTVVMILLFLTALWADFVGSVILFCLMRISFSFADSSYSVICIDMAGQFSGVIKGISFTFSSIAMLLNPLLMGYMVSNHTPAEYNRYFLFLGGISAYGVFVFVIFGSGELQPWAVLSNKRSHSVSNTVQPAATSFSSSEKVIPDN